MPTLLHVGCGPKTRLQTTPGFRADDWQEIRLDIDPAVKPDVIGTMTDMSSVPDQSIDAVFSSHNVEHLYAHEVPIAFREFWRVLNDDGYVVVTCPDLESICALVAQDKLTDTAYQSPAGPITPLDMLYGHRASIARGNHYMAHRVGYTRKVLTGSLSSVGFGSVIALRRPAAFDLWAIASKSQKPEQDLRDLAKLHFPRS